MQANTSKNSSEKREETSLKGTLASVLLLGGLMIVTWVSMYLLYLSRI